MYHESRCRLKWSTHTLNSWTQVKFQWTYTMQNKCASKKKKDKNGDSCLPFLWVVLLLHQQWVENHGGVGRMRSSRVWFREQSGANCGGLVSRCGSGNVVLSFLLPFSLLQDAFALAGLLRMRERRWTLWLEHKSELHWKRLMLLTLFLSLRQQHSPSLSPGLFEPLDLLQLLFI